MLQNYKTTDQNECFQFPHKNSPCSNVVQQRKTKYVSVETFISINHLLVKY
jgi:hypothetical protein